MVPGCLVHISNAKTPLEAQNDIHRTGRGILVRTGGREMNYFYFHFADETTEIQRSNLPRVL